MAGLTLDTGVLIGLERHDPRAWAWLSEAIERGVVPTVPAVALAESWRGGPRSAVLARALRTMRVRALDEPLARATGELLAKVGAATTIDAVVVASAARHGEAVLTGDPVDLRALASVAGVEVFAL